MKRKEFIEFEARTKLPARATKEELERIGANYLRPEDSKGRRMEQMMYVPNFDTMYVWKRAGPTETIEQMPFEIHLEKNPNLHPRGSRYYPTLETS